MQRLGLCVIFYEAFADGVEVVVAASALLTAEDESVDEFVFVNVNIDVGGKY